MAGEAAQLGVRWRHCHFGHLVAGPCASGPGHPSVPDVRRVLPLVGRRLSARPRALELEPSPLGVGLA
jgi:hypothetical protein